MDKEMFEKFLRFLQSELTEYPTIFLMDYHGVYRPLDFFTAMNMLYVKFLKIDKLESEGK